MQKKKKKCVCVKLEHAFPKHSFPALKGSSLALVPAPKVFISSAVNTFVHYLEGGLKIGNKNTS